MRTPKPPSVSQRLAMGVVLAALLSLGLQAHALCETPIDRLLDDALQVDLLTRYDAVDRTGPGSEANVDSQRPCMTLLEDLMNTRPNLDPPSLVSRDVEERLGGTYVRRYLVSMHPDAFALPPRWLTRPDQYGEEVHVFPNLQLVMIRVATVAQFANLIIEAELIQTYLAESLGEEGVYVHVSENFPMQVAVDETPGILGFENLASNGYSGEGLAIAVLDTGVDPTYFPQREAEQASSNEVGSQSDTGVPPGSSGPANRVIHNACFSSRDLFSDNDGDDFYLESLCHFGAEAEMRRIYTSGDHGGVAYIPFESIGNDGDACSVGPESTFSFSEEDIETCLHGTRVAYVAAGIDPDVDGDGNTFASGVAPDLAIISLRIVSLAPSAFCPRPDQSCIVMMPLDALRAMHYLLEISQDPMILGNREVVAANLSFHSMQPCPEDGPELDFSADAKSTEDESEAACEEALWEWKPYKDPCPGPFADIARKLRNRGVWTVVAAGNHPENESELHLGSVSYPGCVEDAVTVAATELPEQQDVVEQRPSSETGAPTQWLWPWSKIAYYVDVAAPGVAIETPVVVSGAASNTTATETGTSIAAPFVTGALALVRESMRTCPHASMEDEWGWLKQHLGPVTIDLATVPEAPVDAYLRERQLAESMHLVLSIPATDPCDMMREPAEASED